jgi:hypothetical protein
MGFLSWHFSFRLLSPNGEKQLSGALALWFCVKLPNLYGNLRVQKQQADEVNAN